MDNGNIQTLYTDEQKQNALYPRTVLSAVSGLNGQTLQENLDLKASNTVVEPLINIWDEEWEIGSIDTNGNNVASTTQFRSKNFIPVKPNTTYYFSSSVNAGRTATYNSNRGFVGLITMSANSTFTTGNNVYFIRFVINQTSYSNNISINYPSTYTSYYPSKVSHIKSIEHKLTRNLLKPTLATTTLNGVTCTNNGDGTYTLSGTANAFTVFELCNMTSNYGGMCFTGCPSGVAEKTLRGVDANDNDYYVPVGGSLILPTNIVKVIIVITSGTTLSNVVFKPMITTDLNATYNDFVSWEDSIAHNEITTSLCEQFSYNANTPKGVLENRISALDVIISQMKSNSAVGCIRYSGGFYYSYTITRYATQIMVTETAYDTAINFLTKNGNTWTLLWTK